MRYSNATHIIIEPVLSVFESTTFAAPAGASELVRKPFEAPDGCFLGEDEDE